MEFKGTKGKWKASAGSHYYDVDNGFPENGNRVNVSVFCYDKDLNALHLSEESAANAQAISAVPEMIAALQIAIKAYKELGIEPEQNCYKQAEEALNKALSHEVECEEF